LLPPFIGSPGMNLRLRRVPHELKFVNNFFFWNTCLKASFSSTFGWKHLISSYCQHYNTKELNSFQNKSFEHLCKFSPLILPTNTTSGINKTHGFQTSITTRWNYLILILLIYFSIHILICSFVLSIIYLVGSTRVQS
jgi:hypothetical protein